MTNKEKQTELGKAKTLKEFHEIAMKIGFTADTAKILNKIEGYWQECGNDQKKVEATHAADMRKEIANLGKISPCLALAFRPIFGSYRNIPVTKVAKKPVAPKVPVVKPVKMVGGFQEGDVLVTCAKGEQFVNYRFWKVTHVGRNKIETMGLCYDIKKLSKTQTQVQPNEIENKQTLDGHLKGEIWVLSGNKVSEQRVIGKFDSGNTYINVWNVK